MQSVSSFTTSSTATYYFESVGPTVGMAAVETPTGRYRVSVEQSFIAQHFLTVPNPGPEGVVHSHQFRLQVIFTGDSLNEYGYLVDIDAIKDAIETVIETYGDETLNELPPFEGLNPSVEHFARIVCEDILETTAVDVPTQVTVRLWEDDEAYASFTTEI